MLLPLLLAPLCQLYATPSTLGPDGGILLDDGDADGIDQWELVEDGTGDASTDVFHQFGGDEHLALDDFEHLGIVDGIGYLVALGRDFVADRELEVDGVPIANDVFLGHHTMIGEDPDVM